jgi:hypothetical protein
MVQPYDAFHPKPSSSIYCTTHQVQAFTFLPAIVSPIHVEPHHDKDAWKRVGKFAPTILPIPQQSQPPSTITTFAKFVKSLPPWEADLLQHISLYVNAFTSVPLAMGHLMMTAKAHLVGQSLSSKAFAQQLAWVQQEAVKLHRIARSPAVCYQFFVS